MTITEILSGIGLLLGFFAVFFIGKKVNDLWHREYDLNEELVKKDNAALALTLTGYYGGMLMTVGGALHGPSGGFFSDLGNLFLYGLSGIVLLNISWLVCDKLLLYKFRVADELIRDQNQGTGAVAGGVCLATGFILYGAITGEGSFVTMLAFWASGQALLLVAGWVYNRIVPYDVHEEIEKDNVAAGISFAGALIAMGMLVGLTAAQDFESWHETYVPFVVYSALGLAALPVVRWLADKVLLVGESLSDEIARQEVPNVGAAYIEAFSYIAGALAIYWCV